MKLSLTTRVIRDDQIELFFSVVEKYLCCSKMADNYGDIFVPTAQCENYSGEIQFAIHKHIGEFLSGDHIEMDYFYQIDYCPFCGEKIHLDIIREEDVTDEYNKLQNEETVLEDKIRETDSKSEEGELRKKLRGVRGEINNMLNNKI